MLDHSNINVEYELPQSIPYRIISSDYKRNLYLLVKEAVHNAIKHSGADLVNIKCAIADTIEFTVTDNGRGFDTAFIKKTGNGLFNYKKRIGKLNGHYQLITAPGKGTKIIFTIPFGNIL